MGRLGLLALVASSMACAPRAQEATTLETSRPLRLEAPTSSPPAREASARAGTFELPLPPPPEDVPSGLAVHLTTGEPPGAAHPDGTVFVTGVHADFEPPLTLDEYDLGTARSLRDTRLPVPVEAGEAAMLPWRGGLDLISDGWSSDIYYLHLGPSLELVAKERVGHYCGGRAIAGEGDVTMVVAEISTFMEEGGGGPSGTRVVSFDSRGRKLGQTVWEATEDGSSFSTRQMADNLVVTGGRGYLLLVRNLDQSVLFELERDARVLKKIQIPSGRGDTRSTLRLVGDHLEVDGYDTLAVTDVTLDLSGIRDSQRPPDTGFAARKDCYDARRMGDVDVALCWREHRLFVEWSRGS